MYGPTLKAFSVSIIATRSAKSGRVDRGGAAIVMGLIPLRRTWFLGESHFGAGGGIRKCLRRRQVNPDFVGETAGGFALLLAVSSTSS
jgi:hypothetical protein